MRFMNTIISIRKRLGLSQVEFAAALGVTQGTVSNMEIGRYVIRPNLAQKVIEVAASHGLSVTYDDIYRPATQPTTPQEAA
ncbi:XRE family transcriptional regulator [Azoarcus communis]|uniref:XRE family transcriptional regulator n=2 Tax=Parazoarcus communis TaxID=41977 RepID=A0A323URH3_9RHOO|nr:XRE family transcriptional regulator [Azoarcus communis] [Parazoarcus communis SWub3 = DSM 12120]